MLEDKEMRAIYCDSLIELSKENENIVVIDADLATACGTLKYKKEYPTRHINVGIAEANMAGVAAGLATCGKVPFINSFGPFASRRCYDQVTVSIAYAKLKVCIVGFDPGVTAEANGGTHTPLEDMSLMRVLPNMICVEPTDGVMLKALIPQIIESPDPVYIRLLRKKADSIYANRPEIDIKLGKANVLTEGNDITLIASGIMVNQALEAAKVLAEQGISAEVIDLHTWQPLDSETVLKSVAKTKAVVTCENHSVTNGLGSAIAELLCENAPAPLYRVGVRGRFSEVGKRPYLEKLLGLTIEDIVTASKNVLERK